MKKGRKCKHSQVGRKNKLNQTKTKQLTKKKKWHSYIENW
jgi:hypothetical protein